jgi:hypothetical protein
MSDLKNLIFYGNDINQIISIKKYIDDENIKTKLFNARTKQKFIKEQRDCEIVWISKDKKNIISSFLKNLVKNINQDNWKFKLSDWQTNMQYTKYCNFGHHYDWHTDVLDNSDPNLKRLITIIYCLTPKNNYKGCKLEIKYDNEIFSKKLDEGDYVVFPSNLIHRATQLISGEREVLVGWYG